MTSGGRLASREKRVAEDEADGTIVRCKKSQFYDYLSVSIGANVFQELLRREKRMSEKETRPQTLPPLNTETRRGQNVLTMLPSHV